MSGTEIPKHLVPITYEASIAEDKLVMGESLENGMVVLLAYAYDRTDPIMLLTESDVYLTQVAETSRWCRVTDIVRDGDLVSFIGEYADGSKFVRTRHKNFMWIAKVPQLELRVW